MRFETKPGQQMQAEFVVLRRGGERLSAFVATLGYGRMSFVRFVTDETWPMVKLCLESAFGYLAACRRTVTWTRLSSRSINFHRVAERTGARAGAPWTSCSRSHSDSRGVDHA